MSMIINTNDTINMGIVIDIVMSAARADFVVIIITIIINIATIAITEAIVNNILFPVSFVLRV